MVQIRLSEFRKLSPEEQEKKLQELVEGTKQSSAPMCRKLEAKIANFEQQYGFSSVEMRRKLNTREIKETNDICDWLMTLNLYKRLSSYAND